MVPGSSAPIWPAGAKRMPLAATRKNTVPEPATIRNSADSGTPRGNSPTRSHAGARITAGTPKRSRPTSIGPRCDTTEWRVATIQPAQMLTATRAARVPKGTPAVR